MSATERRAKLETALDNIATQIQDMSANPKPTYSVDGVSYSWGEHWSNLTKAMAELREAMVKEEGAWEVRSRGIP